MKKKNIVALCLTILILVMIYQLFILTSRFKVEGVIDNKNGNTYTILDEHGDLWEFSTTDVEFKKGDEIIACFDNRILDITSNTNIEMISVELKSKKVKF